MAYTLRYYKTLPQPGDRDIILEIYEKDGAGASVEIGPVIQALHLDIQGSQEDIDTPVVKTSLVMTFVDAPDHEEASSKKCGNWEEFYTPDSTYWKVVLKKRTASGSFTPIWGGYVTPDSFTEQLRYRGSVTIVARDNIGHMQDFPFDSKGNEDGMITVYDLVNTAWAKIESPMSLNWRGEEDEAMWLQCDGHDVTGAYLNVSAFKGMNWYEAMEKVLYSIGAVMRYVGDNTVQVSSLRYMPYQGRASMSSLAKIEPKFIAHANRELVPAVRRIEESVKYDISEVLLPLVEPSDFRGDVINGNVWPLINTESGNGWCNVMPSTALYFNPNGYAIEEYPYRPAFEMAQEQIYDSMFLLCNTEGLVEYSQVFAPMEVTLEVGLGGNIWLKDGKITNTASTVIRARYAIKAFYNGIDYFLDEDGSWTESYVEYTATREGESSLRIKSISHSIPLQAFDAPVVLHFYILELFDLNAEGKNIYVQVQSLKVIPNDNDSLLQTNNVNTIYNNDNNVIISRDPTIGPAYDFVYQGIIKNGMFIKSGDVYLPAKAWAWSGGTPQQMAVYNHLQLLCYHAKPNNVITGDIVNADLGNLRALYMWHGSEHLLQGGSLNFLNGRIEGAILREFARYDEMWGDVTGDSMPATEQESSTNVEEGGSSSGSSATYDNTTNVTIGGSGGGVSVTVDTFLSDTSTNPVQNKIIKQYIDTADNLLDEKIGNLAEHIDDLESSKAVIFDATSSTDPWELNVLQTSTTIEEMAEAINNGSPIYMRFGSGLVAVDNAELYQNGDVSLYVHLVDSESELIRTIHTYSTDGGWAWESTDNPMGGDESDTFAFVYDSTTNKATAEMVAGLASAITANKLIVCNGRVYKFILEDGGMYGLVSDAYMDITDSKLKASVLAVMASTYDVQLMEQEVPTGTEITETTIRNWGFTKNTGTITGITMNGVSMGTSGAVDLGNVITEHQQLKTINNQSIVGSGNITIQGGGGATPRVEMTAASAAIEPNKFYVWPMMDSLDLTLADGDAGVMNRYLFQFRNPVDSLTMLTLPDDITWSEDTELDENGMPVMEAKVFYRIEIIEGLASLKKWKLAYIQFVDVKVETILLANGVGDGVGITKEVAKNITDIGQWFKGSDIEQFPELAEHFVNVKNIKADAFRDCVNLRNIDLALIEYVSYTAFQNTGLSAINLPSVIEIGNGAFINCPNMSDVSLGKNVTTIGGKIFGDIRPQSMSVAAPVPPQITSNTIPSGLPIFVPDDSLNAYKTATYWSAKAAMIFGMSQKDALLVPIPFADATAKSICVTNFDTNGDGELIPLEAVQVTTIAQLFKGASAMTSFDEFRYFGSVTSLNDLAFSGCTALEYLTIPTSVTRMGWKAFENCGSLKVLTILKSDAIVPALSNSLSGMAVSEAIYVPDALVDAYKTASYWSNFASKFKPLSEKP